MTSRFNDPLYKAIYNRWLLKGGQITPFKNPPKEEPMEDPLGIRASVNAIQDRLARKMSKIREIDKLLMDISRLRNADGWQLRLTHPKTNDEYVIMNPTLAKVREELIEIKGKQVQALYEEMEKMDE